MTLDNKVEIKQALDKLMAHVEQCHLIYKGTQPEFEKLVANLMVKTAAQPALVRHPLTRMEIQTIVIEVCDTIYPQDDTSYSEADSVFYGAFARAIEAAHGITTPKVKP